MNKDEALSSHEKLARKFEQWQKEYYDEVNAAFLREDKHSGKIAFDSWEQRFLPFLKQEAASLFPVYRNNVQSRAPRWMFGDMVSTAWKSSKGDAVESFLGHAIREARAERLITEPVNSDPITPSSSKSKTGGKIFIGHGRSNAWRDLKDFLQDQLRLEVDEFNREPTAGYTTVERLVRMLDDANFAVLVMTAEDEHTDKTFHARQNVIHEAGLFQGKLGFKKAIILLEEGCEKFSNIDGLTYIPFPNGNIKAASEEIRRVLEREGILE